MSFKLQQIPSESKFCQHLRVQILEQCYPRELVSELLTSCHAWEQRERKLTQLVIVYYIMALALFRQFNVTEVFAHLSRGLRWLWPDDTMALPTGGALTARRRSLGIIVLRRLFRQCCRPLATEATKGAFALGWRLMAIDGTLDEVPDTPANALQFGRLTTGKSQSPFPQVRCVYLAEVGTHAIVDAVLARCRSSEHTLAQSLLRSIQKGMLVMTDRNFVSVKWLAAVPQRGAQVLSRLASGVFTQRARTLADGSYLVTLRPKGQDAITVRVIEYRLRPEAASDLALLPVSRTSRPASPERVHRLVTTLLDPVQAPALDLIMLYHERWAIELVIDEIKTHQRRSPCAANRPNCSIRNFTVCCSPIMPCGHGCISRRCKPTWIPIASVLPMRCMCWTRLATSSPSSPLTTYHACTNACSAFLRDPKSLLPPRRLRFCPRVVKRAFSSFHRKQRWHLSFSWKNASFQDLLLI
jgi:Insertion element 4 transposase N-terminal/Transposase DDE domain